MDFKNKVELELLSLYDLNKNKMKELKELRIKQSKIEDQLADILHQIYCLESVHKALTPPNPNIWVL